MQSGRRRFVLNLTFGVGELESMLGQDLPETAEKVSMDATEVSQVDVLEEDGEQLMSLPLYARLTVLKSVVVKRETAFRLRHC